MVIVTFIKGYLNNNCGECSIRYNSATYIIILYYAQNYAGIFGWSLTGS